MRSAHRHSMVFGAALLAALAMTSSRTHGQGGAAVASNDFPNPYKIENFVLTERERNRAAAQ